MNGPTITYIGALIVAVGAFIAAYGAYKKESESKIGNERRQVELINQLSGGDSVCEVMLVQLAGNPRPVFQIMFTNLGKFPLYDVAATFTDCVALENLNLAAMPMENRLVASNSTRSNIQLGNLAPSLAFNLPLIELPEGARKFHYYINVTARNGSWSATLVAKLVDGKWVHYVQRSGSHMENVVKVFPTFPRNAAGEPDLN